MRIFSVGPFHLNAELLKLSAGSSVISVGPKVVETLLALIELGPGVVTKDALIARVWPDGFTGEPNLSQNVYVLRKLFRDYGSPHAIETQARIGYRLAIRAMPVALQKPRRPLSRLLAAAVVAAAICIPAGFGAFAVHRQNTISMTVDSERLYTIGRYYWNLRSRDGVSKSLEYFSQAIERDPRNPRFYAAMADANVTMGDYCFGTHKPSVYFSRAERYADEALMLDVNSPEAHASVGFIRLHQNRIDEALGELQTAIHLDGTYAPAREWYGIALMQRGDTTGGRAQLALAERLDPLSVATIAWLGSAAYAEHRYRDAIGYSKMALELSPSRMDSLAIIGQSYTALGNMTAASAAFERFGSISPYARANAAAMLAVAEARTRRIHDAQREYAYARAHAGDVEDADLAAAAKALGDFEFAQEIGRRHVAHVSWMAVENAHRFALEEDERAGS